jgi:ABC-type Mn2+/Zn2+ transport system ATPase subunit
VLKVREVSFKGHPILGNLSLNFCREDGCAAGTVILAGENGVGKSAIMEALYDLLSQTNDVIEYEARVCIEQDGRTVTLGYERRQFGGGFQTFVTDGLGLNTLPYAKEFKERYPAGAIYSDVDISFQAKQLQNVTSLELDSSRSSRRSTSDLPTAINQLIIDIQAQDDADFALEARNASPDTTIGEISIPQRMPRFTNAFAQIFEDLSYSRVENRDGHKEILFEKFGMEVPIQSLSSGEKQIVYRGAFMLRDANALNGALVFIDEPEISLHPSWQKKILDYYKAIFTDERGMQTSQIFCVTHSPFVIHSESRRDDKVLVLSRDENGTIVVSDKPEYYECNSISVVRDAFALSWFAAERQTVFVEGPTDERYFNKAVEVFKLDIPYVFRWIGRDVKGRGQVNTGESALRSGSEFLISAGFATRTAFLFDCDVRKYSPGVEGQVLRIRMPQFLSGRGIKKGIENALVLDDLNIDCFYRKKSVVGEYGQTSTIVEPDKAALCDLVCGLDASIAINVLENLKDVAMKLVPFFECGTYPSFGE